MELWWVGPKGWWTTGDLFKSLTRYRDSPRGKAIKLLGMVSDRRLCELYQQAAFVIYPSLYEGFGFPVLDSLMHETPVLCSFNSSLQEFASPGIHYFDPCDAASLDQAYQELKRNEPPAFDRARLRARFSWRKLAETILALCA
jgi:glycosyltransferase involved in cell wall biosynthesis